MLNVGVTCLFACQYVFPQGDRVGLVVISWHLSNLAACTCSN